MPGTRFRYLGLLAFLGVSVRCQAPGSAASFASVPQGSHQVPGTRFRCLGLLAFPKVPFRCQAPGSRDSASKRVVLEIHVCRPVGIDIDEQA